MKVNNDGLMLSYQKKILDNFNQRKNSEDEESFITVRLNEDIWLVDLSNIIEALVSPKMTNVNSSPSWLSGFVGVRGQVWSVINIYELISKEKKPLNIKTKNSWITLIKNFSDYQQHKIALQWTDFIEISNKTHFSLLENEREDTPYIKNIWLNNKKEIIKELDIKTIINTYLK